MQVLATKLHAPAGRGRIVERARLRATLDTVFESWCRLALVSAPAGFGKTTLVSEWANAAARDVPGRRMPAAWVSLDEGDNDLGRMLAHVVEALVRSGAPVAVGRGTPPGLDAAGAIGFLAGLMNRLTQFSGVVDGSQQSETASAQERAPNSSGWLLVLDDYHVITAPEIHEVIGYLLDHLPEQLRLLIATRADPPLPLAKLRGHGQLVEVRAADLRFTHAEAGAFFNDVMQLGLEPAHIRALDDRTDGWAAGLQLAALSLRGRSAAEDVSRFVAAFAGSNRFVVDYLADEVLARQPADVRSFLLRTSVLDRLTASLCDAVTDAGGGADMLARLDRENLFVIPLDDERIWYRYHHLFADVLRARLLVTHPGEIANLHRAASDWYATGDVIEEAVQHAFAAGDYHRAARLVARGLGRLRRDRRDALMLTWLRALPPEVVKPSAVLSAAAGWARMIDGDLAGVEGHLDDADAALAAQPPTAAWREGTDGPDSVAASVHLYRAALAQARGDQVGIEVHARAALDLAGAHDHFVRGGGTGFLGLVAWARGSVVEALTTFEQAAVSLRHAGNDVDALDTTVLLADMWVSAGYPSKARDLCERMLTAATSQGEPYPRATADLHTCLAELALGRDDLSVAEAELSLAAEFAEGARITENRHRWPAVAAGARAASGDFASAFGLLEQAARHYRPGFHPDLRPFSATEARFAVISGELRVADRWMAQSRVHVADEPEFVREYEHLTLVRVLLAHCRRDVVAPRAGTVEPSPDLAEAADLLDRLEVAAVRDARHGSVLEIRALKALVQRARGETTEAVRTIVSALETVPEVEGYRRLFCDEGSEMTTLLRAVAGDPPAGSKAAAALARLILRPRPGLGENPSSDRRGEPTAAPADVLPSPLSERERDVLRLLQSELSGPEIARQLYISLNTLRTHTKHIFAKLDVTTRAAAVRRGRECHLI